jgi:hypothetical protein
MELWETTISNDCKTKPVKIGLKSPSHARDLLIIIIQEDMCILLVPLKWLFKDIKMNPYQKLKNY